MPCSPCPPEPSTMAVLGSDDGVTLTAKSRSQLEREIVDLRIKIRRAEMSLGDVEERLRKQKMQSNKLVLGMRQRLQRQDDIIQELREERDQLMTGITSRLLLIEAELRREQKQIETLLEEKDRLIEKQGREIQMLRVSCSHCIPPTPSSASLPTDERMQDSKVSRRFSIALDEYIRDCTVVSYASPLITNPGKTPLTNGIEATTGGRCVSHIPVLYGQPGLADVTQTEGQRSYTGSNPNDRLVHTVPKMTLSNGGLHHHSMTDDNNNRKLKRCGTTGSMPDLYCNPNARVTNNGCHSIPVRDTDFRNFHAATDFSSLSEDDTSVMTISWYNPPKNISSSPESFSDRSLTPPAKQLLLQNTNCGSLNLPGLHLTSSSSEPQNDSSIDSGYSYYSSPRSYEVSTPPVPNPVSLHESPCNSSSSPESSSPDIIKSLQGGDLSSSSSLPFSVVMKNPNLPETQESTQDKSNAILSSNISRVRLNSATNLSNYSKVCPSLKISENSGEANLQGDQFSGVQRGYKDTWEPAMMNRKIVELSGSYERLNGRVGNGMLNSANRNFGTNHRSVTKPRDIKFRKLTKFQNRHVADGSSSVCVGGSVNEVILTV